MNSLSETSNNWSRNHCRKMAGQKKDHLSKDPIAYFWDQFDMYVLDEMGKISILIPNLEQALEMNITRAIELGQQCRMVLPIDDNCMHLPSIRRECSGPVTLTTDAAPVLMRYLRLNLSLEAAKARQKILTPFYWEYMGNDSAADWNDSRHVAAFESVFNEAMEKGSCTKEWQESGLTIDDLINRDLEDEPNAFTITIVPSPE